MCHRCMFSRMALLNAAHCSAAAATQLRVPGVQVMSSDRRHFRWLSQASLLTLQPAQKARTQAGQRVFAVCFSLRNTETHAM